MASEGAGGLSTAAIAGCIALADLPVAGGGPTLATAARAELAALVGRMAALESAARRVLDDCLIYGTGPDGESEEAAALRAVLMAPDAGPGAAGARDETALLDAAARYQDAWRVLAAGDATDEEKQAHIYDMLEAREDLFDATEVALRAGGAEEAADGGADG